MFWGSGSVIHIRLTVTVSNGQQLTVTRPVQIIRYNYLIEESGSDEPIQKLNIARIVANPVSEFLQLEIINVDDRKVNIRLFNQNGQIYKLITSDNLLNVGKHEFMVDVQHLSSGIYYLSVDDGYNIETLPFIKQ